jgi:type VI secretion system secreted protein Hcp
VGLGDNRDESSGGFTMNLHAFVNFGDDAKGEALDDQHKDWVQLLSLSHRIDQPESATKHIGGASVTQAEFGNFVITKFVDKATPNLMKLASNGKHVTKVDIEILKAIGDKQTKYLTHELKNVLVTSFQSNADGSGDVTETITLSFDHLATTYTAVAQDGTSKGNVAYKYDRAKASAA